MDNNLVQTNDWKNTKRAVAKFRQLLLCSKCSDLMKEPVCLGMCEHMLCRLCAGTQAGDGCIVCHSPAWVKDIQINRQLNSIIQLFSGLESLFSSIEQPDSVEAQIKTQPESSVLKCKKNLKIWFSPRSRKVRCMVEKSTPDTVLETTASGGTAVKLPDNSAAQRQDLSVFSFTSSSQDSSSSSTRRCKNENVTKRSTRKNTASRKVCMKQASRSTQKKTKPMMKKNRLQAINQQWGLSEEASNEKEQSCPERPRRSSKRVSFVSPASASNDHQAEGPQESTNELSPGRSTISECRFRDSTVLKDQIQPFLSESVLQHDRLSTRDPISTDKPQKQDNVSLRHSSKRVIMEEMVATLETTPKRPRASPCRRRKSQMSPAAFNFASSSSPGGDNRMKSSAQEQGDTPSTPVGQKSPCNYSASVASVGRHTSGSPAVMKRNHKGETHLHVAAIKGDVEAVKELLEKGADPNLKDHAGWTPLHEACNLGHLAVVEVLVSRGALLNTPGYENDSPLHDAVRNGHTAIVKLLLELGASQNVLNLYGKRPADYAVSLEMQKFFQEDSEGTRYANKSLSPTVGLPVLADCVRGDEMVVFLASKLSQPEEDQLAKLGELLGGRVASTFSGRVSHVVLPEGQMPTTFSTLLGLLAGCWIVRFSWVEACLQAGKRVPENEHEAGEAPRRSRINRCSLLPPLFDGCFFFLLGPFKTPSKDKLAKLIHEGGGQILKRQPKPESDVTQTLNAAAYHALPGSDQSLCTQYIIYDPQGHHKPAVVRRGKVWSASSSWLINCITAFYLLPVPEP
ncbi:BRCA1-associated RING domain protein 1 isoform X2 [Antennarius striatus]|uniref:BRCA1-associated RING domain protein 1 isoform X2 n=1 Tax=Antennarius striatus TaxID=241820 RepID=UPI0035ADA178